MQDLLISSLSPRIPVAVRGLYSVSLQHIVRLHPDMTVYTVQGSVWMHERAF